MKIIDSPFASEARSYVELDYCVLPILPGSKRPGEFIENVWRGLQSWNDFALRFPTEGELSAWESWPDAGIGLLTGKISGVIALDFDLRSDIHAELEKVLPPSPCRKKGLKGYTSFYRWSGETNHKWSIGKETVLELLSTGRQTLLPPTLHPTGVRYRWLTDETLISVDREQLPVLGDLEVIQKVFAKFDSKFQEAKPVFNTESTDGRLFSDDYERATKALTFLDCNDYFGWVEIGMALRSAFPGEDGFKLWDSWSATSEKYNSQEMGIKWRSFSTSPEKRRITLATLFRRAMDAGWRDELPEDLKPIFISDIEPKEDSKNKWVIPESVMKAAPGITGKLAEWILETSIKPQPALALAAALTCVGALKGHRVTSETDLRTNLFMIGLAPSGAGKQQPMKAVQQVLSAVEGEDLLGGEPTSDAGLLSMLKKNRGVKLLHWDEFGLALKGLTSDRAATHSQAIMKCLNTLFSSANCQFIGKEYANTDGRIPRHDINQPHLCLFGVTAPEPFFESMKTAHATNGFLARFLVVEVENPLPDEVKFPRNIKDIPENLILEFQSILALPQNVSPTGNIDSEIRPKVVPFSVEAKESLEEVNQKWIRWQRFAAKQGRGLDNVWARAKEHAIKIALTVADTDEISEADVAFAINLVERCLVAACDALEENVYDSQYESFVKNCYQKIKAAGVAGVSKNEFTRSNQYIRRSERESILKDLIDGGQVVEVSSGVPAQGRPRLRLFSTEFLKNGLGDFRH